MIEILIANFFHYYFWVYTIGLIINIIFILSNGIQKSDGTSLPLLKISVGISLWIISFSF